MNDDFKKCNFRGVFEIKGFLACNCHPLAEFILILLPSCFLVDSVRILGQTQMRYNSFLLFCLN